ncbi:MAG TPA: PrsW family glutamic-type intramembrane protease [Rectinemataceae bacterium]|nr:PrsW family glutamic-type intramembrane protease [Rectinemataceae bacterium]
MDWHLVSTICIDLAAAALWLRWLRRADANAAHKRLRRAVPLFFVFGLLSAPLSLLLYQLSPYARQSIGFVSATAQYYFAVVGPSEELAKFAVFLILSKLLGSVREPVDAAFQGASVGLGFAVIENLIYGMQTNQVTLLFRSYYTIASHMAWAALAAFSYGAVVYWYEREHRPVKWGLVVLGVTVSCFLHGLSDFLVITDEVTFFLAYLLDIVAVAALLTALGDTRPLSPYFRYDLKDWRKAVDSLGYGIARDPGNWILYQRRGGYFLYGRDLYAARTDFEMAWQLSRDPGCAASLAVAEFLLGVPGGSVALSPALAAMGADSRKSLVVSLRQSLPRLEGGHELLARVNRISAELLPPKPGFFRVQARTGWMDRKPEAVMRARAARKRSAVYLLRHGAPATGRAAARAYSLSIAPSRARKEEALTRMIGGRQRLT